ncbi:hypothetical protein LIER_21772 [Lithospermum erythrorhizon]|uniref:Uncharacterized protein n=1 Tax=Lithospermum erythrorhizon TaxID=34254 RepID=A0AAV3QTV5_LITER
MPFAWLVLTVFQMACLSVRVLPNMALFSVMYNVTYFQVASPYRVSPLNVVISTRESSPVAHPSGSSSGPNSSLLGVTYSLPSSITVTEECAYGLFLKWKESEDSRVDSEAEKVSLEKGLSEVLRERDEAQAQDDDLRGKYEDLLAIRDGLVKSRSDLSHQCDTDLAALKTSLEESEQRSRDLEVRLDSS